MHLFKGTATCQFRLNGKQINEAALQEVLLELWLCVFLVIFSFFCILIPTVLFLCSSCTAIINLPLSLFPDFFHPAWSFLLMFLVICYASRLRKVLKILGFRWEKCQNMLLQILTFMLNKMLVGADWTLAWPSVAILITSLRLWPCAQ